ncbi:MAG: Bax inhibitor-1/YccA family protein, partial [Pseudomonadota bacterium]
MNEPRRQFGGSVAQTGGVAIDQGLRQYMLGVYNYMALGVAGTGLIAMLMASNPALMTQIAASPLRWVGFIGIIGLGFLAPRIIFSGSKAAAHAMYWAYAALWGAMIAPMLFYFQQAGAAIEIYRAFFITASVFGAMSLYGYTTKRDLSGWGSFLFMAAIGLIIAMVVNLIFFQSRMGRRFKDQRLRRG